MNNKINIEQQLTPAAKDALENAITEYKNSILEKASEISSEITGNVKEISIRDIMEAVDRYYLRKKRSEFYELKQKRYSLLLAMAGAIYAIAGLIIYFVQNRKVSFNTDLGIIITISGIIIM
ncbi:MAG: hypothetical protein D4R67_07760, partial [Bacteroidetes bacterium]